ncbi:hypothetical protein FQA47_015710 [Oryzias melastigma]|uniref:Uncharacterized protein n=1 Tax=Oryzias melastigma TaxID=30732 RepID=A0A834C717_ORYME|nr:hypothetical protein FQA47_015710 [Oryzias melastigma]
MPIAMPAVTVYLQIPTETRKRTDRAPGSDHRTGPSTYPCRFPMQMLSGQTATRHRILTDSSRLRYSSGGSINSVCAPSPKEGVCLCGKEAKGNT